MGDDIKKAICEISACSNIPFLETFHKVLTAIHDMPTKDVLEMFLGECAKNAGNNISLQVKYIETIRETKKHFNDVDLSDWAEDIIKIWK